MLAWFAFSFIARAVSCQDRFINWQSPASICHEWSSGQAVLESFSESGIRVEIPNPTLFEKGLPPQFSKVDSLAFDRLRAQFSNLVSTMRESSSDYVRKRLGTVGLKVLAEGADTCTPPTQFNARYDARTNRVLVCPLVTHLPVAAWAPLIAHELGHLADGCNAVQSYPFGVRMPEARENIALEAEKCFGVRSEWVRALVAQRDRVATGLPAEEVLKLKACGLLSDTRDPAPPAGTVCVPEGQEARADRVGFGVLASFIRTHSALMKEHGRWLTYFYASTNCAAVEHQSKAGTYAPSAERMRAFLAVPEVRGIATCESELPRPASSVHN